MITLLNNNSNNIGKNGNNDHLKSVVEQKFVLIVVVCRRRISVYIRIYRRNIDDACNSGLARSLALANGIDVVIVTVVLLTLPVGFG